MAITRLHMLTALFLCWTLIIHQTTATTPVKIPKDTVPTLVIESALNTLNDFLSSEHSYKDGNLISAQKLLQQSEVIYRLTLNLEGCESGSCRDTNCIIDVRQGDDIVEALRKSIKCATTSPAVTEEVIESVSNTRADEEVQDVAKKGSNLQRAPHCPGCPYEMNPTLPGLQAFWEDVEASMDASGRSPYKHQVVKTIRVTQVVPPGRNVVEYELLLEIAQTNCLVESSNPRSECILQPNLPVETCRVKFDTQPRLENSRRLRQNNCSTAADLTVSATAEVRAEVEDQIAQEGQLNYGSLESVPLATSQPLRQNAEEVITEPAIVQTVVANEKVAGEPVVSFLDKKAEFDDFLKDFDIPIKERRDPEPETNRPEVAETPFREERLERKVRAAGSRSPQQSERRGALRLAQKAMVSLDRIDSDNKKIVVVDVLGVSSIRGSEGLSRNITFLAVTTDCLESESGSAECIADAVDSIKACEIELLESEVTVKLVNFFCYRRKNLRSRRSSDDLVLTGSKVATISPKIREFVEQGVHMHWNESGSSSKRYAEILTVKQRVVAGMEYEIWIRLGDIDCSEGGDESCVVLLTEPYDTCLIDVWDRPWIKENGTKITIGCKEEIIRSRRSLRGRHYSAKMLNIAQEMQKRDLSSAFEDFQVQHGKKYESEAEKQRRFVNFKVNMKIADALNTYEKGTAEYGASIFADLTPEEFRERLGLRPDLKSENDVPFFLEAEIPDVELPQEFDWRHYNAVTEVKNQGSCGSCWAFSVTGNVEGQYAIKHGKLVSLSEQELVDCDKLDEGCNGGLQENAYRALEAIGGLELEQDYPYDGEDEKCHFKKSKAMVDVVSAVNIASNETQMAQWLVKNGPMAIGINANAMQLYVGGISHPFQFLCSHRNLDHGVLIVGYGVHTYDLFKKTMPFWIIKNSWGTGWGEQGYYRAYRGDGTCGLNTDVSSAIVA